MYEYEYHYCHCRYSLLHYFILQRKPCTLYEYTDAKFYIEISVQFSSLEEVVCFFCNMQNKTEAIHFGASMCAFLLRLPIKLRVKFNAQIRFGGFFFFLIIQSYIKNDIYIKMFNVTDFNG